MADTPTADWRGTHSAVPRHGAQAGAAPAPNTSYTVGFSSAAVYNNPHAFLHTWKSSGYGADTQGCPAPGTLPSYFAQHQHLRREPAAAAAPGPLLVAGGGVSAEASVV